MYVELCTGDWPAFGYKTPLFKKTYTGTPDVTADNQYGEARYVNNTAKTTLMEVELIPMMRNIYAYHVSYFASVTNTGDYVEIGEYDADGNAIWIRRSTFGGSWNGWYSKVICEGLNVTLYNDNTDKITIQRTKPYGRLFMRIYTTVAVEAYMTCYGIYTEVTKEMIANNSWNYTPGYTGNYPDDTVDAVLYTETKYKGPGLPYYPRRNRVENISIEIKKQKTAMTASGKMLSPASTTSFEFPVNASFDCVLTDLEIAQWRKHMELTDWGNGDIIWVSTYGSLLYNNNYTVDSVEFGDEIEYGTGLYKARINVSIMSPTYYDTIPYGIDSVDTGYPVRSVMYRHSQIISRYDIRNTTQEPIDVVTVKMYHLTVPQMAQLRADAGQMLASQLIYTPPKGTHPFGPHRGDGPFLAKIVGMRANTTSPKRFYAELDLIYYGEA